MGLIKNMSGFKPSTVAGFDTQLLVPLLYDKTVEKIIHLTERGACDFYARSLRQMQKAPPGGVQPPLMGIVDHGSSL